jgi:ribonuclease BN (tRNA processing enzyme)
MRLTVFGCSGSLPTGVQNNGAHFNMGTSSYLLESGEDRILIDAGTGGYSGLRNMMRPRLPMELTAIVITHKHVDHCIDLVFLHTAWWDARMRNSVESHHTDGRIPVYAPDGVFEALQPIANGNLKDLFEFLPLGNPSDELGAGGSIKIGDLEIEYSRTDHPVPTYAVQLNDGNARIVYSSDTGPAWEPPESFRGADYALVECTYLENPGYQWHLIPQEAAEMGKALEPRYLFVTHLWGEMTSDERKEVLKIMNREYGSPVAMAEPGMSIAAGSDKQRTFGQIAAAKAECFLQSIGITPNADRTTRQ